MDNVIVSFVLKSGFGFLKKPDTNDRINFTFNLLHKPALLGILGAIVGLEGHYQAYKQGKIFPEFWEKLQNLKIAIEPINTKNGVYPKTVVKYNNSVGYANIQGGNLIVEEQILISPSFRIFLKLSLENETEKKLYLFLKNNQAEFIPYFGKNDFQIWWDDFNETTDFKVNSASNEIVRISSIFIKPNDRRVSPRKDNGFDFALSENSLESNFAYFERLPVGYDKLTGNYVFKEFVFTNFKIKLQSVFGEVITIRPIRKTVQFF